MKASPARWLGLLALLLGSHAALQAQTEPLPSTDTAAEPRSALRALRQQQTQVFDAQERACYQRFFTNMCLDDVARARRAMLADIKRKEAALDAADRQQRAQDELQQQKEKQQAHEAQLQATDPAATQAQRDKQAAQAEKQRSHKANGADSAPGANKAPSAPADAPLAPADTESAAPQAGVSKPPKAPSGPSAQERAANQAAFDKKQAEAQRRIAEREQARAKAAALPASGSVAPRSLPLPAASAPAQ